MTMTQATMFNPDTDHEMAVVFATREEAKLHTPTGYYTQPLYGLGWAVLPLEVIETETPDYNDEAYEPAFSSLRY